MLVHQSNNISNSKLYYQSNKKFLAKAIKYIRKKQKVEAKKKRRVKAQGVKKKKNANFQADKEKKKVEAKCNVVAT